MPIPSACASMASSKRKREPTTYYGTLRKITFLIAEDGRVDVIREREVGKGGETFKGLANLEEAFAVVRAHEESGRRPVGTG